MANDFGHDGLEVGKVSGKHRVSHPGHAEHGGDGDAAGGEDRGLADADTFINTAYDDEE